MAQEMTKPQGLDSISRAGIASWEDAVNALNREGIAVELFGDGFTVVEKKSLIGVPFIIVDAHFWEGKHGDAVSIAAVTKDNDKVVINDGSSGVLRQAQEVVERRGTLAGMICNNGIRVSTYYRDEKTGETSDTKDGPDFVETQTYYLD